MAVPSIFRTADLTDANFTGDSSYRAILGLRQALLAIGWNLEFEKIVSEDQREIVFSNNGSGFMFKAINSGNRLTFETARSWSDVDTPVDLFSSQGVYTAYYGSSGGHICVVGDTKRFYLMLTSDSINPDEAFRTRVIFVGDILCYKPTDPYPFILLTSETTLIDTSPNTSSAASGVVLNNSTSVQGSNSSSRFYFMGDEDGNTDFVSGVPHTLFAPGAYPYMSNIDFAGAYSYSPQMLTKAYIRRYDASDNVNGTEYINAMRGLFPGLWFLITPIKEFGEVPAFSEVTYNGINFITVPKAYNQADSVCMHVLELSDWDVI
tara:strand:- start:6759 stop:7721 length:963 start_codon:yes stop_codon:yes gene_type:complete